MKIPISIKFYKTFPLICVDVKISPMYFSFVIHWKPFEKRYVQGTLKSIIKYQQYNILNYLVIFFNFLQWKSKRCFRSNPKLHLSCSHYRFIINKWTMKIHWLHAILFVFCLSQLFHVHVTNEQNQSERTHKWNIFNFLFYNMKISNRWSNWQFVFVWKCISLRSKHPIRWIYDEYIHV